MRWWGNMHIRLSYDGISSRKEWKSSARKRAREDNLNSLSFVPHIVIPNTENAHYDPECNQDDVPVWVDGTEGFLVTEFCRVRNCSLELYIDEIELWGDIYENRTGSGIMYAIATRQTDIVLSGLYYWIGPYRWGSYTAQLTRAEVTVLVPKPLQLAPWKTPFLPFTGFLWIAVGVAFMVGAFAVWLIENGRVRILNSPNAQAKTLSDSLLTLMGFYMEQSTNMRNDLMCCIFLFTSLLLAGFMVGNLYGAGLAGVMTIPQYERPIDTTVDLANSGMLFAATAINWIYSFLESTEPHLITLTHNFRVLDNEQLIKHSKTRDLGFIGEFTEFGHFTPTDYLDTESSSMLRILNDDQFWESTTAIVTKTSPFLQSFNDLVMNVRQSGIQHFVENRVAAKYMDLNVQENIRHSRQTSSEKESVVLTVSHFLGAFLMLALGFSLASVAFAAECLFEPIARIWSLFTANNIADLQEILIIILNEEYEEPFELYTTNIFGNGSRGVTVVQIRPITGSDYFPDKSKNLQQIPLKFSTMWYPPYISFEETTPDMANARYDSAYKVQDAPAPSVSPVVTLLNYIALTYLSDYYAICLIKTTPDYIAFSTAVPTMIINVDQEFNETFLRAIEAGCQAYLVSDDALLSFLDVFITVHDAADQRSSNKLLITVMNSNNLSTLTPVKDHPNIVELPDVMFIMPNVEDGSFELYTTELSNNGTRGTVEVIIRPIHPPDYFPNKFLDMRGIPIRLCTLMYPPYVYYKEVKEASEANARYDPAFKKEDIPLFFDGTEATLILEFCIRHNCTIEASFDEVNVWGEVFDNHTGTGLLGAVIERRADIAVAAIYYWRQPYKFGTYTQPVSRSGITVLVPKPRMLPPWRTPFLSFTGYLWLAVFVAFCVGAIAVWLIEIGRYKLLQPPNEMPITISDAMLTMIGFYMEQSARMRTDMVSCVFLFTSLLFAGFMVGNSYGGGLAGVMTIPQYEKPIDTAVDLADSGMLYAGGALSWIFSIIPAPQPYMKKLVKNYRVVEEEYLYRHTKTHDLGFVGERTEFNHFVPSDFVDNEASTMLQLLKDDLYWETVVALVTKTSPFRQEFNNLLMQVKQSGIQHFWELRSANRYLRTTVQLNIWNARSAGSGDEVIKLTISHFLGAYLILAIGLGLGALTFAVEVCRFRVKNGKRSKA
ncbi:uncharacterized protein LOC131680777 [Topomyia yanbarensis]|uniref:uncharacterized protein LOC131680777 n=1 Tax=Topomyia yanbarensis TaxID=2498891 RepID=UPI00273B1120|nr:uncharacterized protein LOC131680777 [Topomyia yanbarensis]